MARFPVVSALLAFLSGAATILLWSFGLRWVALFLLGWIAVLGLALFRRFALPIEKLFLYTLVLASSIRMDVHVVHVPGSFGFPLSLGDVWWVSLVVLWFFRQRVDPRPIELPRRIVIPFALLLVGGAIAVVPHPEWSTRLRMLCCIVQAATIFLYAWNVRLEAVEYRRMCGWIAVALVVQGSIGALQGITRSSLGLEFFGASEAAINTTSFTSFSRVGGTVGQPNRFAMFVNTVIFVPVAMTFAARTGRARIVYALVFVLAFGALLLSQSRGAWLGFAAGFVAFAWLALRERMSRLHASLTLGWALAAGVAFVVLFPPTYERLTAEDQDSAYSRIPMSLTALEMIRHNPWGVGFAQYVSRMSEYDVTQDGLSYRFRFPVHNAFLLLAAEQGIWVLLVGLFLFVVYYKLVLDLVHERPGFPRIAGLALAAGMLAMHLQQQVEISHVMINFHEWFVMGMVVNVLRHLQRARAGEPAEPPAALAARSLRSRRAVPASR